MPISLDTPIAPPPVVAKEITRFLVDLDAMTVYIRFTELAGP